MPAFITDDYLANTSVLAASYEDTSITTSTTSISVPGRGYGNLGVPDEGDADIRESDVPREVFVYSPYTNFMYSLIDSYITERHTERVETTDYPVESGFVHSDHAVVYPTTVEITGMSSNFSLLGGGAENSRTLSPRSENAWVTMREMMHSRTPMFLDTRLNSDYTTYPNMIITDLETTLDVQTGASLPYRIVFKQVRQQDVRFKFGTMIDPNRVSDVELIEGVIKDNDDYSSIEKNDTTHEEQFTNAFSEDNLKRARISDRVSFEAGLDLRQVVEGQTFGSFLPVPFLRNGHRNIAKLEDEVGEFHRNKTSRLDIFEVELRDKQFFDSPEEEGFEKQRVMLRIKAIVGLPYNLRSADIFSAGGVRSRLTGGITGQIVQRVLIDITPDRGRNDFGKGTISGTKVDVSNIEGKHEFEINGISIGMNIHKGIGKPEIVGDRVYITQIRGDQEFSINGINFTLLGSDIQTIRESNDLKGHTYTNDDGQNVTISDAEQFQKFFSIKIAELIESTINSDTRFDVTVNAFGPADDVEFHIQNIGITDDAPTVTGSLFGTYPTSSGSSSIGHAVARLLQEGIRDILKTPDAEVRFIPELLTSDEVGPQPEDDNIGQFFISKLGDKVPRIKYGEKLFGSPTSTGFKYTIRNLDKKEIDQSTFGGGLATFGNIFRRFSPVSIAEANDYANPQPSIIATGHLEPGVSLVGDPNKLHGDFVVESRVEDPVPFINSERVWDDWDLVFMPKEEFDPIHQQICEEIENRQNIVTE